MKSVIEDKLKNLLSDISINKSRVLFAPPIIFLCGGVTEEENIPPSNSVREHLLWYMDNNHTDIASQIEMAETFKDWLHDAIYKNLLTFEDEIAQIASLVVIILESPGAIAEFGSFCINVELQKKLVIFISEKHYEEDSFIRLGPIRYMESLNDFSVYSYPWDEENLNDTVNDCLSEMATDIKKRVDRQGKSELFNESNSGHIAFLIFEIIKIYRALKFNEIINYLSYLGLEINKVKVRRLLFLLNKLGLVDNKKRGHLTYYYCIKDQQRISFASTTGQSNFDINYTKMATMQHYLTSDKEMNRLKIISNASGKMEQ